MGSIFDKLNHLREVKTKLRQKLEERDVTVTDENTFQEYVDKVDDINTLKKFLDFRGVKYLFKDVISLTEIPEDLICGYDLRNITDMSSMFYGCKSLTTIPLLDTSNVTNMNNMFSGCSKLTSIPKLDTSNVENTICMFALCSSLTTIPLLDTSNVTIMNTMFDRCSKLTTIPQLDTSNVKNMTNMFYGCSSLRTIPLLDTSNVKNMNGMFSGCSSLTTIPLLDTSNVTDMSSMFYGCSSLTTIPLLDTSNVTSMSFMFYDCSKLTTIPQLDTSNVKNMTNMFYGCSKLTDCRLKNIKANLQVGSGTTFGHLLTVDSLLFMIGELVNVNASRTFTVGSANLTKLSNIYVRTINITDAMRAEDALIDQKLPFEVCTSSDSGAKLVSDYVRLKNWSLK